MAGISQFSTPERYAQAIQSRNQLQTAITEAQTAVAAGVPNAEALLSAAQDGLAKINQFISVYFPNGQPAQD